MSLFAACLAWLFLCPSQKKTCLFHPEETLALAFDGVRRVGDHNFNRRLWQVHELKMKKGGNNALMKHTPRKIFPWNPEIFPLEKENHLPKPSLSGPMLILGGVPSSHRIILVLVIGGIILSPRRQYILLGVWAVCQLGD